MRNYPLAYQLNYIKPQYWPFQFLFIIKRVNCNGIFAEIIFREL